MSVYVSVKQLSLFLIKFSGIGIVISNGFAFCTEDVNKNALISILNILSLCPLVVRNLFFVVRRHAGFKKKV